MGTCSAQQQSDVLQESHSRLGQVLTTSAEATAKAVVRKAAAQAVQRAISKKQEETGDTDEHRVAYKDAREKEKKMGALISSLVALAHASGVAQERALFMEVASREVNSQMKKLSGGAGHFGYCYRLVTPKPGRTIEVCCGDSQEPGRGPGLGSALSTPPILRRGSVHTPTYSAAPVFDCSIPPAWSWYFNVLRRSRSVHAGSYLEFGGAKKEVSRVRPPVEERVDQVTGRMQSSVQNMLFRIESELDAADNKIGQKLHLLACPSPMRLALLKDGHPAYCYEMRMM